jgi:hypothetical protein
MPLTVHDKLDVAKTEKFGIHLKAGISAPEAGRACSHQSDEQEL